MEDKIAVLQIVLFVVISCSVYLFLLNRKVLKHAKGLFEELEKLRYEKSILISLDCLLENPNTISGIRKNTNKLKSILFDLKCIDPELESMIRRALMCKIEENIRQINAIIYGLQVN